MRYLLDTNVISDFARGDAAVGARLRSESPAALAVSTVTVMEVTYGLALSSKHAKRLGPVLDALLAAVHVLPLSVEDARAAALVRAALRRAGRPIGPYDVLLAGAALARGLVFVTANVDEFARVSGLVSETWRVDAPGGAT